MIQVFLRICGDDIIALGFLCRTFGCHSELVLTIRSNMFGSLRVIPGLTGYLIL